MTTPQVKAKPSESPTQATNEGNKTFEKKEHQLIYDVFLDTLKDPEKQVQQEFDKIHKIWESNEKKLPEEQKQELSQKLNNECKPLRELSEQLKDEDEKEVFAFVLENSGKIFNGANSQIKSLSEENFYEFLLSIFREVREQDLAREEKLNNGEIKKVVNKHIDDIRCTEAKHSLIKSIGLIFGIKIDPENIISSFMSGLKEKIPFLGKDEKEGEPPLSDEERVTTFSRKIFLPAFFSIASILVFGPTTFAVVAATIGAIFAIKGGLGVLFSNDKKGTLYNPDLQDKDDKEKRAKLNKKILYGINEALKTPVQGSEKDNEKNVDRPNATQKERLVVDGKKPNAAPGTASASLENIFIDQLNAKSESPVKDSIPNL